MSKIGPWVETDVSVVRILGREYRISGDEQPEHLERVAAYLDGLLRDIQATLPDTQDAAMLAALNLASEIVALREGQMDRRRVQSLIDLVDSV